MEKLISNIEFWFTGGLVVGTKITTNLSWHANVEYSDGTGEKFSGEIPLNHENNTNAWNVIALESLMMIFNERAIAEKEINAWKKSVKRFNTGDIIKHEKSHWQCIVCDERTACFGLTVKHGDHDSTSYQNTFLVSQTHEDDGFEYELTKEV